LTRAARAARRPAKPPAREDYLLSAELLNLINK
jgi:hypothetical protein